MSRARVQLAVSADGFISPPDKSFGWLEPFPADQFGFGDFIASIGSIVMGRKSYEEMVKMGPAPFDALPMLVVTSRPLPGVATTTVAKLGEAMERLRQGPKDVWIFGGGETIAACLEQRLVDTFELAVIPRLLGAGQRLFTDRRPALDELRLVRAEKMKKDVLWLEYALVSP